MSLSDPSAIVLIIGAIAIVGFLVHGLWFSNKPTTRKLAKNDKKDQEIRNSDQIGKVRIVTTESAHINQSYNARKDPSISQSGKGSAMEISTAAHEVQQSAVMQESKPWKSVYEINIVAPANSPYRGEDIESVAQEYGFLYGELNIYYVYENPEFKQNEVFRICSLKEPFSFPEDMTGYTTPAIAIYMNLPPKGKGMAYFRALRVAADILTSKLGGVLEDNHHNILNDEILNLWEEGLIKYDAS